MPKQTKAARRAKFPVDSAGARELQLFIDNDFQLYRQQHEPIIRNLMRKRLRGGYDHEKSVKLWGYLVENGAKKYAREFGNPRDWSDMFNPRTRELVARKMARRFKEDADAGQYDGIIPQRSGKPRTFKARR
jgi:hypothetical protein